MKLIYHNSIPFIGNYDDLMPIPENCLINAFPYEEVCIIDNTIKSISKEKYKEKIIGILELNTSISYGNKKKFYPYDKNFPMFHVCTKKIFQPINMYVIIKFTEWKDNIPIGYVESYIGCIGSFENDIKYLTAVCNFDWNIKYNFLSQSIDNKIIIDDKFIVSVDNDDTKDIDDAIYLVKKENKYELGIHILDMNSYILPANDELKKRIETIYIEEPKYMFGTSKYSLIEGKYWNCISIIIYYEGNKLIDYEIKKTKVKISQNTTYDIFFEKINDLKYKEIYEFGKMLYNNDKIYDTHKMIEIFMKTANELVSNELKRRKIGIFRSEPNEFKYDNSLVSDKILQKSQIIKMKKGIYTINPTNYTHMTSPARRYIDVVVHQLLFDECSLTRSEICLIIEFANYKHELYRKCSRDYQLLKKLYELKDDVYEFDAYVIDIDFNYIALYVEKLDIIIHHEILNKKIIENTYIEHNENKITYEDLNGLHQITLFDKIKILLAILLKTNEHYKINIIPNQ